MAPVSETSAKRRRKRRQRASAASVSTPPGPIRRRIPPYDYAQPAAIDAIHDASLKVLEEIGIEFRDQPALTAWQKAGARVDGARVHIPRQVLMELVALAPEQFVQHARNAERSVTVGGDHLVFSPVYGPPFVRDLTGERRYARLQDLEAFVKLAWMLPALNHSGGPICEPTDVPVPKRHLDMTYAHMCYSDKPFMGSVTSAERAEDCVEMCRILFGEDYVDRHTVITSLINCNSPLVWDETMIASARVYARHNQAVIVSPFIMQGASAPITTAGAMVQSNAEALAAIAYLQLERPGAPVVYGAATSTVSMRSGAPMYGTSEAQTLSFLAAQLARRYRVPVRMQGMRTGSKSADAQSGFESVQSMYPTLLSGGHFHTHTAGWLESGLSCCYAKFILDADQLTIMQRLAGGLEVSDATLALDAIREVGPGGQYLGCSQTLERFADEFFTPASTFNDTFEQWSEEGSKVAAERGAEIARQMLDAYEAPALDPQTDAALRAFITKRKAHLPDTVD